ncbi:DUF916 and DUF3324 domain-containing protein [Carnobacterium maltaromaticum]|uniref:DUF916 and DUF3324 domain-containing protein n=1 Tax=Carnobacterium maltaromaticum TaxID=2751 RepID=A0AAW9JTY3_CARML|nr:DUF916 and DUF3324 domain-containing protein [Carnobacterium maltaromaticum]MDZ5759997.1 DUF916 and DUF3324 domain-containing protein [Carnobacterium maltaromaticum]
MRKKRFIAIFIVLVGLGILPTVSKADTMAYSVKADIPENQIDKAKTYFDLKMTPGQKQEITLTVRNSGEEEMSIFITPNNATTNQNGVIDYSEEKTKKDSSLKFPLTSIISGKQEVKLKAGETKQVPFTIQMPETEYDGDILGGFYIQKKDESDDDTKNQSVQIKNQYSYVIGIRLNETDTAVMPKIKLNQIKPALQNYRTAVTANLQNTEATIINDLDINASVTKQDSQTVLHETNKKGLSMAPNSNFDYPITWDNEQLVPGKYTVHIKAKSGEQDWNFDKNFEIKAEVSNKLNKEAVDIVKSEPNWILIIIVIIGVVILVGGLLVFLIIKNEKKKRIESERKARIARNKRKQRKKMEEAKNSEKIKKENHTKTIKKSNPKNKKEQKAKKN